MLIQDLRRDLDLLGRELEQHPVRDPTGWLAFRNLEEGLRHDQPMIADDSVDCVVRPRLLPLWVSSN